MYHASRQRRSAGRVAGFTLVEMLVVITIIGILAAILIPAVGTAIRAARRTAIATELADLGRALERYKMDHKDYPPDFSNSAAVAAHVRRAFPKNTFPVVAWLNSAPANAGDPDPRRLDGAEALVVWLSRTKKNPRNPFFGSGADNIYYTFKEEQFTDVDGDGWPEYASPHSEGVPYVYFDGRIQNDANAANPALCAYAWTVYPPPWSPPVTATPSRQRYATIGRDTQKYPLPAAASGFDFGVARPYRSTQTIPASDNHTFPKSQVNSTLWVEPGKFQVICAGLNGHFGIDNVVQNTLVFKTFPTPNYYDPSAGGDPVDDRDNIASFSESKALGDAEE